MFTVAITGPDGAGKTTIINRIKQIQELSVKHIYMGIMLESGNIVLPTTRLILKMRLARARRQNQPVVNETGKLPAVPFNPVPLGFFQKITGRAGALFLFANLVAEEWYRQIVAWIFLRQGNVVLYDRHFTIEMLAYRTILTKTRKDLLTHFHGRLLERFYPMPDLVIYLDAPAELLFKRKGERTLEQLESWRQGYLGMKKKVHNFVVVDATRSIDEVSKDVIDIIWKFHLNRSSLNPKESIFEIPTGELGLGKDGEH
jgi:thymidylate kinase